MSRRVSPIRIGRPVVPPVAWMRTIVSSGAHWLMPSSVPSACDSAISPFSMNGMRARSSTLRTWSGRTPPASSLARKNGLVAAS